MFIFPVFKALTLTRLTYRRCCSATWVDPSLPLLHVLQLAIDHKSLKLTQQSHSQVCRLGLDQHSFIVTKLVSAYSASKNPFASRVVFNSISLKNVFLWNTLINGYARNELYVESFGLFNQMCRSESLPDEFTFSTLAKVSGSVGDLVSGKCIHGRCVRCGFVLDTIVANSIMSLYIKCGDFLDGQKVFDEITIKSVSSWNALIAGHAISVDDDFRKEIWKFVKQMQIEGLKPDAFTVSTLLPLCEADEWDYGKELHGYIVRNELLMDLDSDVHLGCCLIDMYSKSKKINWARRIFDWLKFRNVYSWTAMVNCYVQNGDANEALVLFREMQGRDGIEPNKVSLVSVLPACSSIAGITGGKQIHGFSIRKELNHEASLCNALIDMYSKCGGLNTARQVFEYECFTKDSISWSSMICGYGLHGKGQDAIDLYYKMLHIGIRPDMITVVAVLSACGRSGLVEEGLKIYSSAVNDYRVKPTSEICACMADMLGRSGQLDRALDFIKTMPVEAGPGVWGALVSASILHGNSQTRDLAYQFLVQMEPENPSNFVSLSNLYASSQRWDIVAEVRTMMKERGLRKLPGCSWISISSETHSFFVADKAHPKSDVIYEMLDELILAIKGASYAPDVEDYI